MKQRPIVSKGLPQTVSNGAVCLCKIRENWTNYLIFNMQAILQRRGILMRF